jgi:hypothetical protein
VCVTSNSRAARRGPAFLPVAGRPVQHAYCTNARRRNPAAAAARTGTVVGVVGRNTNPSGNAHAPRRISYLYLPLPAVPDERCAPPAALEVRVRVAAAVTRTPTGGTVTEHRAAPIVVLTVSPSFIAHRGELFLAFEKLRQLGLAILLVPVLVMIPAVARVSATKPPPRPQLAPLSPVNILKGDLGRGRHLRRPTPIRLPSSEPALLRGNHKSGLDRECSMGQRPAIRHQRHSLLVPCDLALRERGPISCQGQPSPTLPTA